MKLDLRTQIMQQMQKQKVNVPEMARRIRCNQQTLYNFFKGSPLGADYLQAVLRELGAELTFRTRTCRQ